MTDIHHRISSYVLIQTDITAQKKLENQLKFKAFHDSLTGVPNRMMLQKQVQAAIEQKERFGLLFLDCDNFKEVNDQFGHDIGDEFLIQYAHRLTSCICACDEVYRLGGDEFVILLRQIERREEIQQIMERIHGELQKECSIESCIFTAASTIGAAYYPENGESFQELLKQADQALYKGKRQGKNNVNFYKKTQSAADSIDKESIV
ncbi:diguanylate cyclase domain-containing protein [Priestia megaterium]|uniref:diguanylate cyclase domain-containing protein n=1 Tax=Priestia megaterium TaxID=1404 RepID=UPI003A806A6D